MGYGQDRSAGAMAQTSSPAAGSKIATPETALNEMLSRLRNLREHFAANADRMQRSLDRAIGGGAAKDASQTPRPVPNGLLGEVTEQLEYLAGIAQHQTDVIDRMDAII